MLIMRDSWQVSLCLLFHFVLSQHIQQALEIDGIAVDAELFLGGIQQELVPSQAVCHTVLYAR